MKPIIAIACVIGICLTQMACPSRLRKVALTNQYPFPIYFSAGPDIFWESAAPYKTTVYEKQIFKVPDDEFIFYNKATRKEVGRLRLHESDLEKADDGEYLYIVAKP